MVIIQDKKVQQPEAMSCTENRANTFPIHSSYDGVLRMASNKIHYFWKLSLLSDICLRSLEPYVNMRLA